MLSTQIQEEFEQVDSVLTSMFVGLVSRWRGSVEVVETLDFKGRKRYDCGIEISLMIAQSPLRWRTIIHELLHARSVGLNSVAYRRNRGWEEGTVENLQRLVRMAVLSELGINGAENAIADDEKTFTFEQAVKDMEVVRLGIRMTNGWMPGGQDDAISFYSDLLKLSLEKRSDSIILLARQLPVNQSRSFLRLYSTVSRRLGSPD